MLLNVYKDKNLYNNKKFKMIQDYSKAKIYKITNDYNDEVYIGHTCDILIKRFSKHKEDSRRESYKHRPLYKLMNEIGYVRFRIDLIEEWEAKDRQEIRQKEGKYIREMGTLNNSIECRTEEEKKEMNMIANKEKITCECGCIVNKKQLLRHTKTAKHLNLMMEKLNLIK